MQICFNATDASVQLWLESPELAEMIEKDREEIFSEQLKQFGGVVPVLQLTN